MRYFIALEIPEENNQQLKIVQDKLLSILPNIKLTDYSKLHLTLAFIGEQPESISTKLSEVINQAAAGIPSFEVTPSYVDGFPHLHQARVLWAGVKGDVDKLMTIRHRIKDGLVALDLDVDERRFIPHIALAKARDLKISKTQEEQIRAVISLNLSPIKVSSIKLFQSIPNHGFHEHNTLAEAVLR
jgi:RNA 2',3'-cyclic 3'-phosphodiesterase